MTTLGIDLVGPLARAAVMGQHGLPVLVPDRGNSSSLETAALVSIGLDGCFVGHPATLLVDVSSDAPLARDFAENLGAAPCQYVDGFQRSWPAEPLCALVLRKLIQDAEDYLGTAMRQLALITPARFGPLARRALKTAAFLAGAQDVTLIEDAVAAVALVLDGQSRESTFLTVQIGEGGTDASLVSLHHGALSMLSNESIPGKGAQWLHDELISIVSQAIQPAPSISAKAHRLDALALEHAVRSALQGSSHSARGAYRASALIQGQVREILLSANEVQAPVSSVLEAALGCVERCLAAASVEAQSLARVLILGEAGLVGPLKAVLVSRFGFDIARISSDNTASWKALGAVGLLERSADTVSVPLSGQAVASASVGLYFRDTRRNSTSTMVFIEQNTHLPARASKTLFTSRDDQTRMILELVQVDDTGRVSSLGNFSFGPIVAPRRNLPVQVEIALDREGLVHISAWEQESGAAMRQTAAASPELSLDQLSSWKTMVGEQRINE